MLAAAIEADVAQWIDDHAELTDENDHRQVVRKGHHHPRALTAGLRQLEIEQPRVHDQRSAGQRVKFTSRSLPPCLPTNKGIEELIPWLCLKGIPTGDMNEPM